MLFIYVTTVLFVVSICSAALHKEMKTCSTPEGKAGLCVFLIECESLKMKAYKEKSSDYLYRVYCGNDGKTPKFCCANEDEERFNAKRESELPNSMLNSFQPLYPPDVSNHRNLKLLNEDTCGKMFENEKFNGVKTEILKFPWMALLIYRNESFGNIEIRCGGSVINKRYILTAAHCVTKNNTLRGVKVGLHNLKGERDCVQENNVYLFCVSPQDIHIESIHVHPQYSSVNLQNDIALLRLETDINSYNEDIKPICLPVGSAITLHKKKVVVTGWGITESGPQYDELLQNLLPVIPNEVCEKNYKGHRKIRNTEMCVGGENKKTSCIGDTGGPLQSPANFNNEFKYVQYGINSFGYFKCDPEHFPTVYTRVDYYMDWILDTIRE